MNVIEQLAFPEQTFSLEEDRTQCGERFRAFVERQTRFVFQVAYSILRNVADSDDLVQETFLKLYRTGKWRSIDNERAFLARTAWRLAVDRLSGIHTAMPDTEIACPSENPEQAAIAADWTKIVHRLMDGLPEELRQPLALSSVGDLTTLEIAAILGIPHGTVRSRISRARQILKQKLKAYGH